MEVGVAEVEESETDHAAVDDFRANDKEAEFIAPDFERFFGRRNSDSEVIEALVLHFKRESKRPGQWFGSGSRLP